ncbi:MAG: hypothetical protein ACMG6E_03060 [Candidatus Roizmanbacteria bacterium]
MKTIVNIFALLTIFFCIAPIAFAGSGYGQYTTPGTQSGILIDKFVGLPHDIKGGVKYTFVDNLGPQDFKFRSGYLLFFKIRVQNVSGTTLEDVTITDTMPDYLQIFGDIGTVNMANKTVTVHIGTMGKDETKEFQLKARVLPQEKLPSDKGLFCLLNKVSVTSSGGSDEDTAQFCVEKQVLGVKEVPKAGGEGLILTALSSLFGLTGLKLRKKS